MLHGPGNSTEPSSVRASATDANARYYVQDSGLDIARLLNALWRGKWLIIGLSSLAFVLSGLYAYRVATPVFAATAQLVLDDRQQTVTDLEGVVSGLSSDQITINTELEVMRSRRLIGQLVDQLDLTTSPEYNPWLAPAPSPFGWQAIKDGIKSWLFTSPPQDLAPPDADRLRDIVVNAVRARISTGNLNRTSVFTITASSTNPERATILANTLSELYILDQLETKFLGTRQATEWLSDRVADLRVELEADEAAVKALNVASDLVSARDLEARNRQIKNLRDRFDALNRSLDIARNRQANLQAAVGDTDAMLRAAADPSLTQMMAEGGDGAESRFVAQYNRLLSQSSLEVERTTAQVDAIASTLEGIEVNVAEQSLDLVELQHLQREAAASRTIYEYFLARLKETRVQEGTQRADSRILSVATRPNFPTVPRKKRMVLNATGLAALLAGALVIGWELVQKGFRTAEDLENATGYPVVGQVPLIPGAGPEGKLRYLTDKPNSAPAEAIRNLRTSVVSTDATGAGAQVIMFTSSVPGEGKTTQAVALAQNIAAMGRRVLLIEGDIRRPAFRASLSLDTHVGLSEVVSGHAAPAAAVVQDVAPGLSVLSSGVASNNAADAVSSDLFATLISWARSNYDVVVIDTPPVLVVPDGRVIGMHVDTILYVVRWDRTSAPQVLDGLGQFESLGRRPEGLVLAQVDPKRMRALGNGQRNGAYAAYGQAYYER